MAYGSILGQTPTIPSNPTTIATNVSYNNSQTSSVITGNNVQTAIDQLFTSVSNGKSLIASAITDMGISTSSSDTFQTMANNIKNIETIPTILQKRFTVSTSYAETQTISGFGSAKNIIIYYYDYSGSVQPNYYIGAKLCCWLEDYNIFLNAYSDTSDGGDVQSFNSVPASDDKFPIQSFNSGTLVIKKARSNPDYKFLGGFIFNCYYW